MILKLFFIFIFGALIDASFAADKSMTIVAVGDAVLAKEKMLILEPYVAKGISGADRERVNELVELFRNDFSYYKSRFELDTANYSVSRNDRNVSFMDLTSLAGRGIEHIVKLSFLLEGGKLKYDIKHYKSSTGQALYAQDGLVPIFELRTWGHQVANAIYKGITGVDSIFESKVIFVSDRPTVNRKEPIKELYIADFDGKNLERLTYFNGNVISPDMSKDRKKIIYSLIKDSVRGRGAGKIKRDRAIELYMYDTKTKQNELISNFEGVNSGAIFISNNDNENIALTLSFSGNAEIYEMNIKTKKLRQITKHLSIDVDPSFSADGKLMTFLSGRSGDPMVYIMDPSVVEQSVVRIGFVGQFNATPRFSPDGKEIAFSSWLENSFDIFRMSVDGSNLVRLTKDFGSNEEPTYSPDGQFILFSSQRVISRERAVQNLYIMNRDGDVIAPVIVNFGNCTTPRWSK